MDSFHQFYDAIIVGSGISGSFIAADLTKAGLKCLLLEAGKFFNKYTYPRHEIDSNSQLYWGGGIEFNANATIGFLRPKVVGGGSIVNQALLDRFDNIALEAFRETSGIDFFSTENLKPWYEQAEQELCIQTIPEQFHNGNAKIFKTGFEKLGFQYAPLCRAQKNCRYEEGNDCIECLAGCPIDSKQSMPVTVLKKALSEELTLLDQCEVTQIVPRSEDVEVHALFKNNERHCFKGNRLILASGAIGNSKLLLRSGFKKSLPALGESFFTHPQYMVLALYAKPINAHKGPLQSVKSNDPGFRRKGFKLENVFAPPVAIAMLLPGIESHHQYYMKNITRLACIEVAVRDTHPGKIKLNRKGEVKIFKTLNGEDQRRRDAGLETIQNIFEATGAQEIIRGKMPIGLHLMGGCGIGSNAKTSVVNPDFQLHGHKNIFAADSSIFPNAPGINPSLTIMALSKLAATRIVRNP
ncbi:MAG: GMC family oxidoreductase [Deltaproteobacteria bacterium]|nr:GMC family oxidoreductase [Deltaproteobacteria bacterium]